MSTNPVCYICKYTPVELLAAFGGTCSLVNHMQQNFDLSDQVSHPNLCGFGKALLESCLSGNVKELVLVNCCDTIRSVYDVLMEYGRLDFLFLLDILHTNESCSKVRTQKELLRLARVYGDYKKTSFSFERFRQAFEKKQRPDTPYISLLGARTGDVLEETISALMPLPVQNDTCVNNRMLPLPPDQTDFALLMQWYADALLSQIPCMRMTDIQARKQLYYDPQLKGVIYHTVKFCDYYGFEYADLKQQITVPLLKLESDYTLQSSGQLQTRLEAFAETMQPEKNRKKEKYSMRKKTGFYVGIDSGSTSTDVVILDEAKNIVSQAILPTGASAAAGAARALQRAMEQIGCSREDIVASVSTGYGRGAIQMGDESITEITCHAKGAFFLNPQVRTIIDIGGQDSKVIRLDDLGNVINFVMNDKCAAGTGRFLELMARTLELSLEEMSRSGLVWNEEIAISSMCTVFAESEVVSLIAQNKAIPDIVHGLNRSVASKTAALCRRIGCEGEFMMTGGVSKNQGVLKAIEDILDVKLIVSDKAQLNGALGAALFAMEL